MERKHYWFYHGRNGKNNSYLDSFRHAGRGLMGAAIFERNFRAELLLFIVTIVAGLVFNITVLEWVLILLVSLTVFVFELLNSSLEAVADALHPDYNEHIQRAKDMAAGAVLLVTMGAASVGVAIFGPYVATYLVG